MTDFNVRKRELEPEIAVLRVKYGKLEESVFKQTETLEFIAKQGTNRQDYAQKMAHKLKNNQSALDKIKLELDKKENLLRSVEMELTFLQMEVDYDAPTLEVKGRIFPGVILYIGTNPAITFTKINTDMMFSLDEKGKIVSNRPIIT